MVSAVPPFIQTSTDRHITLKVRYYGCDNTRPVTKTIPTQCNAAGRSPRLDLIMQGRRLQPHIHDGIISVRRRRTNKVINFHVFVKNHKHLPDNKTFRRWRNVSWKGDVVVMKKGKDGQVVNISAADSKLADWAVKCFLLHTSQRTPFRFPKARMYDVN